VSAMSAVLEIARMASRAATIEAMGELLAVRNPGRVIFSVLSVKYRASLSFMIRLIFF
jgi:hypothetical protein